MIREAIAVLLAIMLLLFIAGCASDAEDISSEEEAQEAIVDVGEGVSEISDTLKGVDEGLSGK